MILDFIQGAALLLALCWLQTINRRLWTDHCVMAPLLSGLLFGTTCVVGMLTPIVLQQGLIFDARTAVLSMAGLFGGPLVAAVAARPENTPGMVRSEVLLLHLRELYN